VGSFYLAVVKKKRGDTPQKYTFAAKDHRDALVVLAHACLVSSTMELDEFDLMEIIQGGGGYKPVAAKINHETYLYRSNLKDNSKIEQELPALPALPRYSEKVYKTYTLAKA
jgi:hypothetical protein